MFITTLPIETYPHKNIVPTEVRLKNLYSKGPVLHLHGQYNI